MEWQAHFQRWELVTNNAIEGVVIYYTPKSLYAHTYGVYIWTADNVLMEICLLNANNYSLEFAQQLAEKAFTADHFNVWWEKHLMQWLKEKL